MQRYKINFINRDGSKCIVICEKNKLERYKKIKDDFDIAYYRKYPLTNAEKVYF